MTGLYVLEEWKPVHDWEGLYEVSSLGRVRSLWRSERWPGQIRVLKANRRGYVILHLDDRDRHQTASLHKLVLEAFVGPHPPDTEARHLDGNPANNALANLAWGTHAENMQDRLDHGTNPNSVKTHCPVGHEYTPENTYRAPSRPTKRECRACHNDRVKDQWRKVHPR